MTSINCWSSVPVTVGEATETVLSVVRQQFFILTMQTNCSNTIQKHFGDPFRCLKVSLDTIDKGTIDTKAYVYKSACVGYGIEVGQNLIQKNSGQMHERKFSSG